MSTAAVPGDRAPRSGAARKGGFLGPVHGRSGRALRPIRANPSLAGTIILVRDEPLEVLMVRRGRTAAFPSALVFPGGKAEPSDFEEEWNDLVVGRIPATTEERVLKIAAVRETFEETTILLARSAGVDSVRPVRGAPFRDTLRRSGFVIDLDDLHLFSRWVTPEGAPRRFDTYFFLAQAPADHEAVADGSEITTAEWIRPVELIRRACSGERSIMFPTLMNLVRLAESADSAQAIDGARSQSVFTVRPRIESRSDGTRMVIIPAEAGYGVTEYPAF